MTTEDKDAPDVGEEKIVRAVRTTRAETKGTELNGQPHRLAETNLPSRNAGQAGHRMLNAAPSKFHERSSGTMDRADKGKEIS